MPPIRWQQFNVYVRTCVCVFTHLLLCAGRKGFALWWHHHIHCVPVGRGFKVDGWLLCLSGPSSITKIAAVTFWPMFIAVWPDFLTRRLKFCPCGAKSFKGASVFLETLLCTGGTIWFCCECSGIFGLGKQVFLETKWDGKSYRTTKYLNWL